MSLYDTTKLYSLIAELASSDLTKAERQVFSQILDSMSSEDRNNAYNGFEYLTQLVN